MPELTDQWRTALVHEIRRKLIHITGLTVPIGILAFGKVYTAIAIALALIVGLFLEAGRLSGRITLPALRDHEANRVGAYIYYIVGSLITVVLFRSMIAVLAMLMLSIGDAVSGLIGSILVNSNVRADACEKKIKPLPIQLGMFTTCLALGYITSGLTQLPFLAYLAGAIGATIADAVPLRIRSLCLDDNLTIPICSGIMMSLAVLI